MAPPTIRFAARPAAAPAGTRRGLLLAAPVLVAPRLARAQARMLRLGLCGTRSMEDIPFTWLVQRLGELGHVAGRSLAVEHVRVRDAAEYDEGMRELVRRGVDVIAVIGPDGQVRAAMAATSSIPVAMMAVDFDPVAHGLVAGLARPDRNVTGLVLQQIDLARKRLDLFRDTFPEARGATVFWDVASADQWRATAEAARAAGLALTGREFRTAPYAYAADLVTPDGALLVMNSPFFFGDRARLAAFALAQRLRSVFAWREWVDAGGLMSYGPNFQAMTRRLAEYVDRLARGAKPADLPLEQPSRFELVVNLKTAAAIGVSLPAHALSRADEVIE